MKSAHEIYLDGLRERFKQVQEELNLNPERKSAQAQVRIFKKILEVEDN